MTDQAWTVSSERDELIDGARKTLAPPSDLDARIGRLSAAVDALQYRIPGPLLSEAADVVSRASARLRLSADHTVVALAGATGSGKSSTFNALAELDVAAVGVRRPTTSWAMACLWGSDGAADLLEWLGIPQRHQVVRDSLLDSRRDQDLQGMVLLDLPDHDSTEVAHRLEVDRLVHLADVIVWVMDPQKYADAAIHDRLLRPNVEHADVMVAVVNHIDEVSDAGRDNLVADARRLLDQDGLASVPLIATSARFGAGMDDLRAELASRIATKAASRTKVSADVHVVAEHLIAELGSVPSVDAVAQLRDRVVSAIGEARRTSEGGISLAPLQPEVARSVVRTELRTFTHGLNPQMATSISERGMAEVDAMLSELASGRQEPEPQQRPSAPRRGVSVVWKVVLFLLVIACGAWLAAALLRDVPNVVGAGGGTAVALLAFIASLVIKRGGDDVGGSPRPPSGLEDTLGRAVENSVIRAVRAEILAYQRAVTDLRAAVAH